MRNIAISYFLLCQFIEAVLITSFAMEFVFFVIKLSMRIKISPHLVTEVLATLFK